MSEPSTFFFDCDEVLCDLVPLFSQAVLHTLPEVHRNITNVADFMGFASDDMHNQLLPYLIENRVLENVLPTQRAAETVKFVKEAGHRVIVLTARGWHPIGRTITLNWCEKWDIPVDDVITVMLDEDKSTVINRFSNVKGFVDDSASHITSAANNSNVKNLYLFDRPWNQDHKISTNVERVFSHSDLLNRLHNSL